MQTLVMFYILPEQQTETNAHWFQACLHAANCFRNNQRAFIFTDDQNTAHEIDELLWKFEPDSFVPHNLIGEGPQNGSPIEIGFQAPKNRRPVLINLASEMPFFAGNYSHIIDFVPAHETLKQQARERFKQYRQAGYQLQTVDVEKQTSSKQQ